MKQEIVEERKKAEDVIVLRMSNEQLQRDYMRVLQDNQKLTESFEIEIEARTRNTNEQLRKQKEKYIKKIEHISKSFNEILHKKLEEYDMEASLKLSDYAKQARRDQ